MKGTAATSYQGTLQQLYDLSKFGMKLGLQNIAALLEGLGNPQRAFSAVHVAGSNGKGSVAAFLASTLWAAGYRVGLYTSPHLVDFRERIRINGKAVSPQTVISLWQRIHPRVRRLGATYFEAVTAMAFDYFRVRNIDIAVVEVGLGGRLDATNVILPHAVVITNISREHTRWLGSRLEQIAREKAGIIKEGTPVICAETKSVPLRVIRRICGLRQANLHLVDEELRWEVEEANLDGTDLAVWGENGDHGSLYLGLAGQHQVRNAMAALLTLQILRNLGWAITDQAVRAGFSLVQWPGRLQVVRRNPLVLLDVAHNPAGTQILKSALKEFLPEKKILFVFGVQEEKEYRLMIRHLAPLADMFFLTKAQCKGAAKPRNLAKEVRARGGSCLVYGHVKDAVRAALHAAETEGSSLRRIFKTFEQEGPIGTDQIYADEKVVCITGSHYVVGEAMEELGVRP